MNLNFCTVQIEDQLAYQGGPPCSCMGDPTTYTKYILYAEKGAVAVDPLKSNGMLDCILSIVSNIRYYLSAG